MRDSVPKNKVDGSGGSFEAVLLSPCVLVNRHVHTYEPTPMLVHTSSHTRSPLLSYTHMHPYTHMHTHTKRIQKKEHATQGKGGTGSGVHLCTP